MSTLTARRRARTSPLAALAAACLLAPATSSAASPTPGSPAPEARPRRTAREPTTHSSPPPGELRACVRRHGVRSSVCAADRGAVQRDGTPSRRRRARPRTPGARRRAHPQERPHRVASGAARTRPTSASAASGCGGGTSATSKRTCSRRHVPGQATAVLARPRHLHDAAARPRHDRHLQRPHGRRRVPLVELALDRLPGRRNPLRR